MEEYKQRLESMSLDELKIQIQELETERCYWLLRQNMVQLAIQKYKAAHYVKPENPSPPFVKVTPVVAEKKPRIKVKEEPMFVVSSERLANPEPPKQKLAKDKLQMRIREILLAGGKMPLSEIVEEIQKDASNDSEDIYLCIQKMTKNGRAFITFISGKRYYLADPSPIIKPA